MHGIEYNLGYLEAAVKQFDKFLLSNDVYRSIGASSPVGEQEYPQLSLGGVLLSRARLQQRSLSAGQQSRLEAAEKALDETRARWRVAWEAKAAREFHARLNLWRDFMEDLRTRPTEHRDRYAFEVGRRVMLELLRHEAGELPRHETDLLGALDKLLHGLLSPGPFAWEAELQAAFPAGEFWYLYGHPKGKDH